MLMKDSNTATGATIAIPTADAIFRTDFLPSTEPEELAAMTLNQAEKDAPLPIEEITQSYEILGTDGDGTLVISVCAPSAVIDKIRADAGLEIARVQRVDAQILGTIAQLLSDRTLTGRGREILLAEEGENTTLAIVDSGSPAFVRSLGETASLNAADVAKAARLAMIRGKARRGDGAVAGFVLAGSRETFAPLAEAAQILAPGTGIEARVVSDTQSDIGTTGVSARTLEGKSLNVFPREWRDKLAETKFKMTFGFGILGGAALWVLLVVLLWGWPSMLSQRAKTLDKQIKELEKIESSVNDVRYRIQKIEQYSDRTFSPLEALLEIAINFPPGGIDLEQFRYNSARNAISRNNVTLTGRAITPQLVYTYQAALQKSPLFKEVRLSSGPTLNPSLNRQVFELSFEFNSAEDAAAALDAMKTGTGGTTK